ncbi:MAG: HAD family hydrolase [Candidatus Promineifilaceae bacterium]|nr:HAD family hydrolase [Candidatus Promineifilaceae bacterium]
MTLPNTLQAILFDFDGTLIDSFPAHLQAYLEMFNRLGFQVTEEELLQAYTPDWFQVYRAVGLPEDDWELADRYWLEAASRHDPELFPGVAPFLERVGRRYRLGIVTSGEQERVQADLARTGISQHFDVLVSGDDVSQTKPAPQGLEIALAQLDVPATVAVYLGDTVADWRMAQAAGMAFVGVTNPLLPASVQPQVESVVALEGLLLSS